MVTTQFSLYADQSVSDPARPGDWEVSYSFGVASTDLVITDMAWTYSGAGKARLVVDGNPVYAWQAESVVSISSTNGNAMAAVPQTLSLQHGIWVRRGSALLIECDESYGRQAWSIGGYTR